MSRFSRPPNFSFLLAFALGVSSLTPQIAFSNSLALATVPLATATTTTVKPNLLFVIDNSGSMDWDHMPDDASDGGSSVTFQYGYYGVRSSQCNEVYYDPAITYTPPIKADGSTSYSNASFTSAWVDGYNTGSGTVNLNSNFTANQSGLSGPGSDSAQAAYYYTYSGSQTTPELKNYNSTTNTFYNECHSAQNTSPGQNTFTKIVLTSPPPATTTAKLTLSCSSCNSTAVSSIKVDGVELMSGTSSSTTTTGTAATSIAGKITLNGFSASASGSTVTITGVPDTASKIVMTYSVSGTPMSFSPTIYPKANSTALTNFANWYSYYRTRLLMMKTAAGLAFKTLDNHYRVGLAKISQTAPVVNIDTFEDSSSTGQRGKWYAALYGITTSGSTPLRTALSNAGRYYAGKLSGVTDPIQYSCQQNFTILSTDGYWNSGEPVNINGSAFPSTDNQDATASRPMYDGAQANTTITITYTQNSYSTASCSPSATGKKRLKTQPQIGSCALTITTTPTGNETCTPASWASNGSASYGACLTTASIVVPSPNPSTKVESGRVTTAGAQGGSMTSNSLADIAMYYYQTDLRTSDLNNCTGTVSGENVCTNNVFTSSSDNNIKQHMTTFTLGLGASGYMNYASCYLSDNCPSNEDFLAVKLGSTANSSASPKICSWQTDGTVCNWPVPGMSGSNGFISNIDDLWHAAVDGHGAYFAATNPTSLSDGLSNALAGLNARRGTAAAAATSTLNPVAGNNFAFVASYTTITWKGNLEARGINTDTGVVSENATWCAENVIGGSCASPGTVITDTSGDTTVYYCSTPNSVICPNGILDGNNCNVQMATACTGTMSSLVSDASDTRLIYTSNGISNGIALTSFDTTYATANPTYFSASTLANLSQWGSLTATQKSNATATTLVNYLRGQYGYEDRPGNPLNNQLFRSREAVLGDALESQPAFIDVPNFSYTYPGYASFVSAQSNRSGTVYMGANDGMMHAFASSNGIERWAYIPSMVISNLWRLADANYSTMHANYVNGSPITSDICVSNCNNAATAVWKTILVAGLNGGGRGYYALDITVPSSPVLLWEFTTTAGIGTTTDDDLGYSYGRPIITRKADGTWVVLATSGYNNTSPGNGKGYLYVLNAATGAIISKISTNTGSTTAITGVCSTAPCPSGLTKIAAWNDDSAGNQASYIYGGDLFGNVWRFDINDSTTAAIGTGKAFLFATLKDGSGNTQPITTSPTLGKVSNKRVIFIGTGKYLETGDLTTTQTQTIYGIKDDDANVTLTSPRSALTAQTITASSNTATRTASSNVVNIQSDRGWYADLPDTGERVNIDSQLVSGVLLVATTVPTNTACSPGGTGWLNYFNYETGSAVNTTTSQVSTKYDAPIVGINVLYIQGKPIVEVVTSSNPTPTKDPNPLFNATAGKFTGKRVTWRELIP